MRLTALRSLLASVAQGAVTHLPGRPGERLRERYWRPRLGHLGHRVKIDVGVIFENPEHIFIGDRSWIDRYVVLLAGPPSYEGRKVARREVPAFQGREGEIRIGRMCHVASHVSVIGHGGVELRDGATIAAGSRVISLSHHHKNIDDPDDTFRYRFGSLVPPGEQALISSPVVLEDYGALGTNSVLLPGTTIEAEAWVGANSLVRGVIPAATVAAGTPAQVLAERA